MNLFLSGLVCLAACLFAAQVLGQTESYVLTETGTRMGTLETAGPVDDLRFAAIVDGDDVESTHVWAVVGGSEKRQRNQNGYWVAWDGNKDTLIDVHFQVVDGAITYKVLDEDIGDDNHGVTLMIGYKTGGVLKFGYFGVLPGGEK